MISEKRLRQSLFFPYFVFALSSTRQVTSKLTWFASHIWILCLEQILIVFLFCFVLLCSFLYFSVFIVHMLLSFYILDILFDFKWKSRVDVPD